VAKRSLRLAAALVWLALAAGRADAASQNILEAVEEAMGRDQGLTDARRAEILAALRDRFADYAGKVVRPDKGDVAVTLRMIAEGTFDDLPADRIAEVAFAAFQAVSRGAPPEVVEGIGLYGYRKAVSADRIATWANGFNDCAQGGVPSEVGADLVRNAMERDWDDRTFTTFKWSLVEAQKAGFDIRRYAAFLFQHMEAGKEGPGAITARAIDTFKSAQQRGVEVPVPDYRGVFMVGVAPVQPKVIVAPGNAAATPSSPAADAAAQAKEDAARAKEEAAQKAAEAAREEHEAAERAAQQAAADKLAADERAEKAKAAESAEEQRAAAEAQEKAIAAARAAERAKKKAAAHAKSAEKAKSRAARARAAASKHKPVTSHTVDAAIAAVWPKLDAAAKSYLGTPYVWGGETHRGIDCSGFTKNSYFEGAEIGIPRNSRDQYGTGKTVAFDQLQEGDLVFFDTMGHGVSHVGMMVDPKRSRFMHASSSHGVMEEDLSKQYFKKRYLGARRVFRE
jgi:cell wall-associated NlpC family hydrolase